MNAYCKHCQCSHSAWTRLNNGCICGRCGTRERDPQVMPINATVQVNAAKNPSRLIIPTDKR